MLHILQCLCAICMLYIYIMQLVIPKSKNYGHTLSKFFGGKQHQSTWKNKAVRSVVWSTENDGFDPSWSIQVYKAKGRLGWLGKAKINGNRGKMENRWKTPVSKHFAGTMSNFERLANVVLEHVRPAKLGLNIEISRLLSPQVGEWTS